METPRFTPLDMVRHTLRQRGLGAVDLNVAPILVVCWFQEIIDFMVNHTRAEKSVWWPYQRRCPLYTGTLDKNTVSLLLAPVGAAGTVLMMEELFACGVQNCLGLGMAGSLTPSAPLGSLIVPMSCHSDEGTSTHYIHGHNDIEVSHSLADVILQVCADGGTEIQSGSWWTTDAPYRETVSRIELFRDEGVLGVDMETSAMYALGKYRGVRTANLMVVSDELHSEWSPGFGEKVVRNGLLKARDVVLQVVRRLYPS